MRRRIVAAGWVAGATVPLLAAAVFLVGCCVLPFHGLMHKLMPLCETAASIVSGGHHDSGHDHDAVPPAPARDKEPVKHLFTILSTSTPAATISNALTSVTVAASSAPRSFMSLGAVRCDHDVGLHVLVATFLI